jgi:hypothetical protein
MSNGSRDVVYIQKDDDLPYITFGSKLAWNVAKQWAITEAVEHIINTIVVEVEEDNVVCLGRTNMEEMVEFIGRVGIVEVEWKTAAFFHRLESFKEWIK